MQPNGQAHPVPIADLLKALVDGMRTANGVLGAALDDNDPALVGHPDVIDAIEKGSAAVDAYEALAQRLEAEDEEPEQAP